MRMGVSVRLLFALLIALPLLIPAGHCSTFVLNSTQALVNDSYWNAGDEYSPYLDYNNPFYEEFCPDLRDCYIDDTNTGAVDDNIAWIRTNILGKSLLGISWTVSDAGLGTRIVGDKTTIGGERYFFRVYNDTVDGNYDILFQRGTVVDYWDNATLIGQGNENGISPPSCSSATSMTSNTADYFFNITRCGISATIYDTIYIFEAEDGTIIMTARIGHSSSNGGWQHAQFGSVVSIYPHKENFELGHYSYYFDQYAYHSSNFAHAHDYYYDGMIGTNLTSYLDYTIYTTDTDSYSIAFINYHTFSDADWNLLVHSPSKFLGTSYRVEQSNDGKISLAFFPKADDDSYRSVALPLCDDIYEGNTQTSFYFSNPYWYRQCSGLAPLVNQTYANCTLTCTEYANTYTTQSKECYAPYIDASYTAYGGWCSVFDRGDGYGYIFESGADVSDIQNLRVSSWISFNSTNTTEKFAIVGKLGLGSTPNSFLMIYDYNTNDYWSPAFVDINTVTWQDYYVLPNPEPMCYLGSLNISEYAMIPDKTRAYILVEDGSRTVAHGLFGDYYNYYYPIADNYYISAYYKYYEIPSSTNCDTLTWDSNTGVPIDSGAKRFHILATWDNVTAYNTSCTTYEEICVPSTEEGYYIDEDEIICVGLSCFAPQYEICNLDGICDEPYETSVNCPADCPVPTGSEIVSGSAEAVSSVLNGVISFFSEAMGIDDSAVKGMLWLGITIVVGALMIGVGGFMGGALTYLAMMLIGTLIGWMPLWIGIVFIIMAGFVVAKTISDFVRGG